jgi:hypothetical protein
MKDETGNKPADLPLADTAEQRNNVGRPRQYNTIAARQKAYRERLKASGKRVVSKVVLDVRGDVPLHSDIIDLSELKLSRQVSLAPQKISYDASSFRQQWQKYAKQFAPVGLSLQNIERDVLGGAIRTPFRHLATSGIFVLVLYFLNCGQWLSFVTPVSSLAVGLVA